MGTCQISMNFNYNSKYEAAHMPSDKAQLLLDHSKACFHIYSYLCLLANKNEDSNELGFIIKINSKKIRQALGMKLRTVQQCLNAMLKSGLLIEAKKYSNKDNDRDLYINGYHEMYEENKYLKLPEEVFSKEFLNSDKGTMALFVQQFISIYKDVLARLQREKKGTNAQNFELVDKVKIERDFKETTLLTKIKRVSKKYLSESLDRLEGMGIKIKETSLNTGERKYTINASSIIRKMFADRNEDISIIRKYPNTFKQIKELLTSYNLVAAFLYKKDHEDLTQMAMQYGILPLMAGLLSYKASVLDDESIPNKCGYIRTCIENSLNNVQLEY